MVVLSLICICGNLFIVVPSLFVHVDTFLLWSSYLNICANPKRVICSELEGISFGREPMKKKFEPKKSHSCACV